MKLTLRRPHQLLQLHNYKLLDDKDSKSLGRVHSTRWESAHPMLGTSETHSIKNVLINDFLLTRDARFFSLYRPFLKIHIYWGW